MTDDVFAVIAEATRRDILVSLRKGDKAVGELVQELEASQPTISKHLKVLREADLVSMRAQGQKRYYALNPKPLAGIASWLETFDVGRPAGAPAPAQPAAAQPPVPEAPAADSLAAAVTGPAAPAPLELTADSALSPAVAIPVGTAGEDKRPQQIGRTVGRAATRAADLLANLPKFGRRK